MILSKIIINLVKDGQTLLVILTALNIIQATIEQDKKLLCKNAKILAMAEESNKHRNKYNLPAHVLDEKLCEIAQRHANRLARQRAFYHGGRDNIIAKGQKDIKSAFVAWMNSSGHRAWILSNTKRCGYGAQISSNGQWYWVGVFR